MSHITRSVEETVTRERSFVACDTCHEEAPLMSSMMMDAVPPGGWLTLAIHPASNDRRWPNYEAYHFCRGGCLKRFHENREDLHQDAPRTFTEALDHSDQWRGEPPA